ncbi:MAG: hypothetical protein IJN38_03115 [Clostridia bacterium]|nr:hypothetical protein [Clostridia bacterium]
MKKKFIALFLGICILLTCTVPVLASQAQAELLKIYGDDMLFEQEKDAVFAGKAPAGSTVSAELFAADGSLAASAETVTDEKGEFTVSFAAPKGSFEEYTVILKCNGTEFDTLNRVVFGELWLASGQSNMQYPLSQALSAIEDFENGAKQSKWIRAMVSDTYSAHGKVSVTPHGDIPDAVWITGENPAIYGVSAVGFFFAEELLEELDMPIGILNISLGGTSIATWLSREAIDGDEQVRKDFTDDYISVEGWVDSDINYSADMTVNYNLRIEAVRHFRPSGVVWYQGETDIMLNWSPERYARAFDLYQRSYTELFEYEDGLMPVIYTQLAPYYYSTDGGWALPEWNFALADWQKAQPDSRAMVTINDLPGTYIPEAGPIHPGHKEEIGDRMAECAINMLYGGSAIHTAASLDFAEIRNGSIYATLTNVADGVEADGTPDGFAICGDNGVYVKAEAELVSENTVRIWSDSIENPVSATYGYCVSNGNANLYSVKDGEKYMPVSLFVTDPTHSTQYWVEKPWAECESAEIWRYNNEQQTGYFPGWTVGNAEISFNSADAYSGSNGMNIKADSGSFTVAPLRNYTDRFEPDTFWDVENCFENYGTISFYVRNNGTSDITFDGLKIYKNKALWYSPADCSTNQPESVIPADGEWHLVTLNLDKLCLWGNECGILFSNDNLDSVGDFVFCFSGENADISFDHIRFTPETDEEINRFEINIANADSILEYISAFFVTVIGAVAKLFNV